MKIISLDPKIMAALLCQGIGDPIEADRHALPTEIKGAPFPESPAPIMTPLCAGVFVRKIGSRP